VSDANEQRNGAQEAASDNTVNVRNDEQQNNLEEEYKQLIAELEQQVASTRRSELLTQEDYAIQINAQG